MRRRDFIQIVSALAAAWPLATRAQPTTRIARIGFLGSASAAGSSQSVKALREGVKGFGYVESKNIVIEFRWAEGKYERLPELVADLIRRNVDVLVKHGTPGTQAAKKATTSIPIDMAISGDAVATGIVKNLGRPDENVTGSTFFLPELNAKRLELLQEVLPDVTHFGALPNPANPVSTPILSAITTAATPLKLEVEVFKVHSPSDFIGAFEAVAK